MIRAAVVAREADGRMITIGRGEMSVDHPSSSHGLPVLVVDGPSQAYPEPTLLRPGVYGSGDLPAGAVVVVDDDGDEFEFLRILSGGPCTARAREIARAAGYNAI